MKTYKRWINQYRYVLLYGDNPCDIANPPIIEGADPLVVRVGQEFNPLYGVTALKTDGGTASITVKG